MHAPDAMHAPHLINYDKSSRRQERENEAAVRKKRCQICAFTNRRQHACRTLKADACSRPSGADEACVISWGSASSFAGIWGIYAGADLKQAGLNRKGCKVSEHTLASFRALALSRWPRPVDNPSSVATCGFWSTCLSRTKSRTSS